MENLDHLKNLEELNLKMNEIESIKNIGNLEKVQKIFLCENKINNLNDLMIFSKVNCLFYYYILNLVNKFGRISFGWEFNM